MLMDIRIKQLIIIILSFILTFWFQSMDDKKYKKNRLSFFDKYKFPIFVSAIVGLLLNLPELINCNPSKNFILNLFKTPKINNVTQIKDISDQQIYTDLPDF